jgi:hypothetical protein
VAPEPDEDLVVEQAPAEVPEAHMVAPRSGSRPARKVSPPATPAADVIRRFRLLAEALGFDPDEVLAGFAESWLARARDAVRPAEPPGRAVPEDYVAHDD